jgi:hypothetical protein
MSLVTLCGWICSPQPTLAVHTSGTSYTFIGFSMDGNALVRLDDFQFGAKQFETFRLDDDQPRMIHPVKAGDDDAVKLEKPL